VKYAFAVTNGTAALHIANVVLEIKSGDEVICPALTFVATANAVQHTGADVVFADSISEKDLTIDPEDTGAKTAKRTKAITVVHYAGFPCHMGKIMKIAKEYSLKIIEDCTHALLAWWQFEDGTKKYVGSLGDIGCFSFFSNKNLVTGEGGMIVTNNDEFARRIKLLRSHGMTTLTLDRYKGYAHSYDVVELGYNYRTTEINSAIGLIQLSKLDKNNRRRREITNQYKKLLSNILEIQIPFRNNKGKSSCHLFPILLNKKISRERFMVDLKEMGIQTSIHYPPAHLFSYYRKRFGFQQGFLPLTEEVGKREVTLPLYPMLNREDIIYIVKTLKGVLSNVRK